MSDKTTRLIIEELADNIDIPDSAYETAEARYEDLGKWFGRPEAKCFDFDPHIYSQGSFRLGTVVRSDEYDLDFGCRLRRGITKGSHTQKELRMLVLADLEAYRIARGIKDEIDEKNRCWRLAYADKLRFHMDIVPSIPEDAARRIRLQEAMARASGNETLAIEVMKWTGAITDKTHPDFDRISFDWLISNSEGYALWFESRIRLAKAIMEAVAVQAKAAQVDKLPTRKWKSPLQFAIQILKHHRNVLFAENPGSKPISIILTTLAAQAYQGEQDVATALQRILSDMGNYVRNTGPRIPNPVNPDEDFADKWSKPEHRHLQLETNFWRWLKQAQTDFAAIGNSRDPKFIAEIVQAKLAVGLDTKRLEQRIGLGTPIIVTAPKAHQIVATPPKPWSRR